MALDKKFLELQMMVKHLLPDAKSYFNEVSAFGYTLDPIDVQDKTSVRNLNRIAKVVGSSDIPKLHEYDFKRVHFSEVKKNTIEFCTALLGEQVEDIIGGIPIKINPSLTNFDGGVLKHYDLKEKTITSSSIELFRKDLSYSAVCLSHQIASIAMTSITPPPGFHYHYLDIIPIVVELIAADKFTLKLQDPNLLINSLKIRLRDLKENMIEYNYNLLTNATVKNLPSDIKLTLDYTFNLNYSRIISEIFALHLFNLYQKNQLEIAKLLRKCITHQKTIESLLKDLEISLSNPETIALTTTAYQKLKK